MGVASRGRREIEKQGRRTFAGVLMGAVLVGGCLGAGLDAPLQPPARAAERAVVRKQVWFTPGPGTADLLALFSNEGEWATARDRLAVFQFYEGHLLMPPPQNFEGNTYAALRDARAFGKLSILWRKRMSIETGAVKAHYCSDDGSAEPRAVSDTLTAIRNVEAAAGVVNDLSMDEPFYAGATQKVCGAPDAEGVLDRVVAYLRGVKAGAANVSIGLIEPYPYFSPSRIARFLTLLRERGFTMPFFHVDVDLAQMRAGRDDFARDMRYLAGVCASQGTRFGIIFNGDDAAADPDYMKGAWRRIDLTVSAFADWPDMPQDLIFQSWSQPPGTGRFLVPSNLPETTADTHTNVINRATPLLHGPQHFPGRPSR